MRRTGLQCNLAATSLRRCKPASKLSYRSNGGKHQVCPFTELVRNGRRQVTRKLWLEIPRGGSLNRPGAITVHRRIHSCSSLTTRHRLEGETCKAFIQRFCGGKGASRPLLVEFIDAVGRACAGGIHAACIHYEQIARTVTRQTQCAACHRAKGRSRL